MMYVCGSPIIAPERRSYNCCTPIAVLRTTARLIRALPCTSATYPLDSLGPLGRTPPGRWPGQCPIDRHWRVLTLSVSGVHPVAPCRGASIRTPIALTRRRAYTQRAAPPGAACLLPACMLAACRYMEFLVIRRHLTVYRITTLKVPCSSGACRLAGTFCWAAPLCAAYQLGFSLCLPSTCRGRVVHEDTFAPHGRSEPSCATRSPRRPRHSPAFCALFLCKILRRAPLRLRSERLGRPVHAIKAARMHRCRPTRIRISPPSSAPTHGTPAPRSPCRTPHPCPVPCWTRNRPMHTGAGRPLHGKKAAAVHAI